MEHKISWDIEENEGPTCSILTKLTQSKIICPAIGTPFLMASSYP